MSILFVSHSTGDTQAMLAVAKRVQQRFAEKLYFFVLGEAAEKVFKQQEQFAYFTLRDMSFSEQEIGQLENGSLSPQQLQKVDKYLKVLSIDRAYIGTPSKLNAAVPFQVAELVSQQLKVGVIYNDYLYKEVGHVYENIVRQKKVWQSSFRWALPTAKAQEFFQSINTELKTAAVGHLGIDAVLEAKDGKSDDGDPLRQQLHVSPTQKLLFISGLKDADIDKALLNDMLAVLHNDNENIFSPLEIRIGLHPGTSDMNAYLTSLVSILSRYPKAVTKRVKFVLPDRLQKKVNLEQFDESFFIKKNISGDQAAKAADSVACGLPATLVTKAALQGKPAFCHDANKKSFLPEDRFFVGDDKMVSFFRRSVDQLNSEPISKSELGVPKKEAVDMMASLLLAKPVTESPRRLFYAVSAVFVTAACYVSYKLLTNDKDTPRSDCLYR